jgi:glucokinase
MTMDNAILVGDVGGTHARFAIVDLSGPGALRIEHRLDLAQEFPTFSAALRTYIEHCGLSSVPTSAVIAVAGPVTAGRVRFTNRQWEISEDALRDFGFSEALLINDFVALAFAVEVLNKGDLHTIGPDLRGPHGAPISILGPGTGFGVSCLARDGDRVVPIATEGGHMGFAPSNETELALLRYLWKKFERVTVERILSGPGLENIYQGLAHLGGREVVALSAAQITEKAARGEAGCREALQLFCAVFGAVAGDVALVHGARGGVYIAGGIAQKIQGFLAQSEFRARFESKGRLSSFVQAIPTQMILNADAALLGAAHAARILGYC